MIEANANAVPPVAFGPLVNGAYVGQDIPDDVREKVYREGARTIPGREHGGNCDVSGLPTLVAVVDNLKIDQEPFQVEHQPICYSLKIGLMVSSFQGISMLFPGLRERSEPFCWRFALLAR